MKTCFKCGVEKPVEDFYKHRMMADGHLNKCKACTKQDVRNDRQTKPRVREYDRERSCLPHRVELRRRVTRAWRLKHPERHRAHALAAGAGIQKPDRCTECGVTNKRLEKHHADYSKPTDVVWLCKLCHAIADKARRQLEAF